MTGSPTPKKARKRGSLPGFLLRLALIAWVLRSLVLEPFFIPSGSMLPTMAIGDFLFVAKWPYGYSRFSFPWQVPPIDGRLAGRLPVRGDVVVFNSPGDHGSWVKRVIGLPGDTVEVRDGILILNGKAVPRVAIGDYAMPVSPNSPCKTAGGLAERIGRGADGRPTCLFPAFRETLPGGRSYTILDQYDAPLADHFAQVTVPAGTLFMMGDNRDDSEDSRFSVAEGGVGFLPLERIVGRATVVFWSTDGSADWLKPWTWFSALRAKRIGTTY